MARLADRRAGLAAISRVIARSPIVIRGLLRVAEHHRRLFDRLFDLPRGYEAADLVVLDWIAAEALRRRRNYLPL
jgi:hypothetical protein